MKDCLSRNAYRFKERAKDRQRNKVKRLDRLSVPEVASLLDKDERQGDMDNVTLVMEKLPEEKRIEIILQRMRNKATLFTDGIPAEEGTPAKRKSNRSEISSSDSESSDDEGIDGKRTAELVVPD